MDMTAGVGTAGATAIGLLAAADAAMVATAETNWVLIIGLIVGGLILLSTIIYGICSKFSGQSWIGWQVALLLGLTYVIMLIPAPKGQVGAFVMYAILFSAIVALVLGLDVLVRWAMFRPKAQRTGGGWRALDRILGLINAILTFAMFFVVMGVLALGIAQHAFDNVLLDHPIWTNFLSAHAADIFLATIFLLVMRAGYRLGVLKSIYAILMISATFWAFVGCMLFFTKVGFAVKMSAWLGNYILPNSPKSGALIGAGIWAFILFAFVFTGLMILSKYIDKLIQNINAVRPIGVIDGVLVSLIFSVVYLGTVCGLYFLYDLFAARALSSMLPEMFAGILEPIGEFMEGMVRFATSSPLSKALHDYNPLLLLLK